MTSLINYSGTARLSARGGNNFAGSASEWVLRAKRPDPEEFSKIKNIGKMHYFSLFFQKMKTLRKFSHAWVKIGNVVKILKCDENLNENLIF